MKELKQQASHRRRPVPALLEPYIDLANVLPAPERLPEAEDRYKFPGIQSLKDRLPILESWQSDHAYIQSLMDQFPRFREYMAGADLQVETFSDEVYFRCRRLMEVRSLLYTIARWPKARPSSMRLTVGGSIDNPVSLFTDLRGNFRVEPNPLIQAMDGVEADRIRECRICGQIFWAGRTDQACCKRRCAKVLRTRRWREGYPAKYKPQRIKKAEEAEAPDRNK